MGIDIRDGSQLECINCGLCADACDDVMDRIDLPRGLIAYDTEANVLRRMKGEKARFRFLRPRTALYAGVLVLVSAIMLLTLSSRHSLDLDVMRDRNPDHVMLADGGVRNAYTVKLMNRSDRARNLRLTVSGIRAREVEVIGNGLMGSSAILAVDADKVRTVRILVTVAREDLAASRKLDFILEDVAAAERRKAAAVFVSGENR